MSKMDLDAATEMMSGRSQYNITCKLWLWSCKKLQLYKKYSY